MIEYKIAPAKKNQFRVTQLAKNGEPLNSSETLTTKENALKNIKAVIEGHKPQAGTLFHVFDIKEKNVWFFEANEEGEAILIPHVKMNRLQLKRFGL